MSAITRAIYEALSTEAAITGKIATYKGRPAIFTVDPIPADAPVPCIVVSLVAVEPFDTKTSRGRTETRDVRLHFPATGSAADLEAVAEIIRRKFHREPIDVEGFRVIISTASGPFAGADEVEVQTRVVTVSMTLEEKED